MTKRHQPRQLDLSDPADQLRRSHAEHEFVILLFQDPRVEGALRRWGRTSGARQCLGRILMANFEESAISEAWSLESPNVVASLGASIPLLPCSLVVWAIIAETYFRWRLGVLLTGDCKAPGGVQFNSSGLISQRKKPLPEHEGATVRRNVRWLYRARVKDPVDSISQIAREYSAATGHNKRAHPVVRDGIASAAVWLGLSDPQHAQTVH
jgi:hypothetical protein